WTRAAPMREPRAHHASVRLADGRVLVAGGSSNGTAYGLASARGLRSGGGPVARPALRPDLEPADGPMVACARLRPAARVGRRRARPRALDRAVLTPPRRSEAVSQKERACRPRSTGSLLFRRRGSREERGNQRAQLRGDG